MTRVRVRGIYTTALTEFLRDSFAVVAASPPIRERFDESFPARSHDVAVSTTDDRLGVEVSGYEGVEDVADRIASVGIDAFAWRDPTPLGAVFDGRVRETLGSGAIVALGDDREGFLSYGKTDSHVSEGDRLRIQVIDPAPPWDDDRPVLSTTLSAPGGLATLSRGVDGIAVDGPDNEELAGLTDLLSTDVPDGWGVRWERSAADADMDALDEALDAAVDRAETLTTDLDDAPAPEVDAPSELAAPWNTTWAWFGRESRFALDDVRREVTTTMPGHHRIKAGDERASAAVDFVEAVCEADGEFPFDAVTRQFGPSEGDRVAIAHGKPDGRLFHLGRGEVTNRDPDGGVTIRRTIRSAGTYDALGTRRESGDVAITSIVEGRWWYPTVYRSDDGERKGTYVNVCTPVEVFPEEVRYVDLHVDVVRRPDGSIERVDDDELDEAVAAGTVPEALAEKARSVATAVENALS